MTQGKYTEPDILRFEKRDVQRIINGMRHQQAKLMLVGSDGVYFMSDRTDSTDQAFAVGCNPDKDEFDDWWELKRRTWGGDDGAEEVDALAILAILEQCLTHLIVAFKAEEVYIGPKGSSHEGQEFRQGISFEIMSDNISE